MKYVCLIHQGEVMVQKLPKDEKGKLDAEHRAFGEAVQESGQMILSQGLEFISPATTVRVRDGKTLTTDRPFAETKEQLSRTYLIEAKGLNEAIQFAAKTPSARSGSIVVRPVWG